MSAEKSDESGFADNSPSNEKSQDWVKRMSEERDLERRTPATRMHPSEDARRNLQSLKEQWKQLPDDARYQDGKVWVTPAGVFVETQGDLVPRLTKIADSIEEYQGGSEK